MKIDIGPRPVSNKLKKIRKTKSDLFLAEGDEVPDLLVQHVELPYTKP